MPTAEFRFYEELNDFLPAERRQVPFSYPFAACSSVKDVVEALGVPHPEVDLVLVNGYSVGWDYRVQEGDRISVYPVFESFDITPVVRLRPQPLRVTRFLLDTHLGKLTGYLRLLGFDTEYPRDAPDSDLARRAAAEQRILLTRDVGLLKRSLVTHGYYVRAAQPLQQTREVLDRFDLRRSARPFQRCVRCNGVLEPVARETITHRLQPGTLATFNEFSRCPGCDRIYWPGSHFDRMQRVVREVLSQAVTQL